MRFGHVSNLGLKRNCSFEMKSTTHKQQTMKTKTIILTITLMMVSAISQFFGSDSNHHFEFRESNTLNGMVYAYPPAVGILSKSKDCLVCHADNGPWGDESKTIIDVLDAKTKKSLKQTDGSFLLEVKRNQAKTFLTVIGRVKEDLTESPYRNAWIYVDPQTIKTSSLSKFAPGWDCNLQMACRVVGDKLVNYEGAKITALPMTLRPTDAARDSELQLQVMLTKGESVKRKAKQGIIGNYFVEKVNLKIIE